jgi:pyruvyltransferase
MTTLPLRVFYGQCGPRYGNYGDALSLPVVSGLTARHVAPSAVDDAHLVAIGSLADQIPPSFTGAVWGTGLIRGDQLIRTPQATICAVRGKLSASRWVGATRAVLGDPAMLREKPSGCPLQWRLGMIPHYVDFDNAGLYAFAQREDDVTIIDLCRPVDEVEARIASCEAILSSSLHGLIVADAFDIPNRWMVLSTNVVGGGFKFQDYYSVFRSADVVPYGFEANQTAAEVRAQIDATWYAKPLTALRAELRAAFPRTCA